MVNHVDECPKSLCVEVSERHDRLLCLIGYASAHVMFVKWDNLTTSTETGGDVGVASILPMSDSSTLRVQDGVSSPWRYVL